jgi:hypothetical protein
VEVYLREHISPYVVILVQMLHNVNTTEAGFDIATHVYYIRVTNNPCAYYFHDSNAWDLRPDYYYLQRLSTLSKLWNT